MFPEAHHTPPLITERCRAANVTRYIPRELRTPIGDIDRWEPPVIWAAVPEASVDEHGDLRSCEDNVWPNSLAGEIDPHVDSIPEAPSVKDGAQHTFGPRVTASNGGHISAPTLRSGRGYNLTFDV